jgi:hypothetical protein
VCVHKLQSGALEAVHNMQSVHAVGLLYKAGACAYYHNTYFTPSEFLVSRVLAKSEILIKAA